MGCFPCAGDSTKRSKKKINNTNNHQRDEQAEPTSGFSSMLEIHSSLKSLKFVLCKISEIPVSLFVSLEKKKIGPFV